ncbi:MAG: hypothetical protein K2N91_05955, partial [Muribaculaceae bacterium]|nr:hypothetical protein [Muribaculaceae bacterium]
KYISSASTNLQEAKDSVTSKNNQISIINGEIAQLVADSVQARKDLNTARNTLRTLQASPSLQKKTTTGTVGWLDSISSYAENFLDSFDKNVDGPTVWYLLVPSGRGSTLTISFTEDKPNATGDWVQATQSQLWDDAINGKTISAVYDYLGPKYAATNTNKSETLSANYQGNTLFLVSSAVNAITTLTHSAKYQETVTTNEYVDEVAANATLAQIKETENEITDLLNQLNGLHTESVNIDSYKEQINAKKARITTIQGAIKTLEDETIPGYEADTTEEAVLKNHATELKSLTDAVATAEAAVTAAQGEVDTAQEAVDTAKGEVETATSDLAQANQDVKDAEAALKTAQDAADATALKDLIDGYQSVTLNADVNATEAVGKNYAGEIYAEGHIINIPSGIDLFNTFSGTLDHAAINGSFAKTSSAGTFTDVAVWAGTGTNPGRFYDDDGARTTYTNLGTLGYAARDFFGVDFATTKLVALAPTTTVYKLTAYANGSQTGVQVGHETYYYVTDNGTNFVRTNNTALALGDNVFAVSADKIDTSVA